jgi:hypothetical protein
VVVVGSEVEYSSNARNDSTNLFPNKSTEVVDTSYSICSSVDRFVSILGKTLVSSSAANRKLNVSPVVTSSLMDEFVEL